MILNIKHTANWEYIKQQKQKRINENNSQENKKRIAHTYKVGDKILLNRGTKNKYESPYAGPYTILKVYDNGTVQLQMNSITDVVNIRRVMPFKDSTDHDHGGECNMRIAKSKRKLNK